MHVAYKTVLEELKGCQTFRGIRDSDNQIIATNIQADVLDKK